LWRKDDAPTAERRMMMKGCKAGYKDGHKYCVKHRCPCLEESCGLYRELTNADQIRAMSDEELAEDYCKTLLKVMQYFGIKNTGILEDAVRARLEWLKQPAE
jgi:hypothetical protein